MCSVSSQCLVTSQKPQACFESKLPVDFWTLPQQWLGSVVCEQVMAVQLWLVLSRCCTAVLIYKDHKEALGRRPERFSSASVRSIALGPCSTGRPQAPAVARAPLLLYLTGGANMLSRVHHSLGFGMQQSNQHQQRQVHCQAVNDCRQCAPETTILHSLSP